MMIFFSAWVRSRCATGAGAALALAGALADGAALALGEPPAGGAVLAQAASPNPAATMAIAFNLVADKAIHSRWNEQMSAARLTRRRNARESERLAIPR